MVIFSKLDLTAFPLSSPVMESPDEKEQNQQEPQQASNHTIFHSHTPRF
jgi:hypothetical protein